MGGLVATMQEQNRIGTVPTPFEEVEALAAHDGVTRHVPDLRAVRDPEVGRALEQTGKLGGPGHVEGCQRVGELVQEHLRSLNRPPADVPVRTVRTVGPAGAAAGGRTRSDRPDRRPGWRGRHFTRTAIPALSMVDDRPHWSNVPSVV